MVYIHSTSLLTHLAQRIAFQIRDRYSLPIDRLQYLFLVLPELYQRRRANVSRFIDIGFWLLAMATGLFSTTSSASAASKAAWVFPNSRSSRRWFSPWRPNCLLSKPCFLKVILLSSTYLFIRSLWFVCGATILSIIFNSRVNAALDSIANADAWASLTNGSAYADANRVRHLSGDTLQRTLCMYAGILCIFWYAGLALSLLGVGLVLEKSMSIWG